MQFVSKIPALESQIKRYINL